MSKLADCAARRTICVLSNAHRYSLVDRALQLLGLGTDYIVPLAGGDSGKVGVAAVQTTLDPAVPTIVGLNRSNLNIGACGYFVDLCPVAQAAGTSIHVDGAYRFWASASPCFTPLVGDVELADIWATDSHKWFNAPFDYGMATTRDEAGAVRNLMEYTPE